MGWLWKKIVKAFENKVFDTKTSKWKYIQLLGVEVASENGITYYDYKLLKPCRFEHISLESDPQQKMPAK